ncbi:MAG: HNH endonuclease signature motif containing protein [Vicinamibacterales bacterium]
MRYWWVNQNQTYRAEVRGNFMWSPKTKANGDRTQFYENMRQVAPGDIVFSFCDTRIKAVGIVTGTAQTAPKPDFGNAGWNWSEEGWFVPVYYCAFASPIRPKDHIAILRHFLPPKYSPLQANGDGLQSVYLAEVPAPMADALIGLIGQPYYESLAVLTAFPSGPDVEEFDDMEVEGDIGPTFKEQLVKARRGQGVFRSSVLLSETECRVTRVKDAKHLRASHIKPWRNANNTERLNGANGLLLSPHIDHLFDQGYITFSNVEQLLIVPEVRTNLLDKWGIDAGTSVGQFNREQQAFLDYHRANVFRG